MSILITVLFSFISSLSLGALVYPYVDRYTDHRYSREIDVPYSPIQSCTRRLTPETRDLEPGSRNPNPESRDSKPETFNATPGTWDRCRSSSSFSRPSASSPSSRITPIRLSLSVYSRCCIRTYTYTAYIYVTPTESNNPYRAVQPLPSRVILAGFWQP